MSVFPKDITLWLGFFSRAGQVFEPGTFGLPSVSALISSTFGTKRLEVICFPADTQCPRQILCLLLVVLDKSFIVQEGIKYYVTIKSYDTKNNILVNKVVSRLTTPQSFINNVLILLNIFFRDDFFRKNFNTL